MNIIIIIIIVCKNCWRNLLYYKPCCVSTRRRLAPRTNAWSIRRSWQTEWMYKHVNAYRARKATLLKKSTQLYTPVFLLCPPCSMVWNLATSQCTKTPYFTLLFFPWHVTGMFPFQRSQGQCFLQEHVADPQRIRTEGTEDICRSVITWEVYLQLKGHRGLMHPEPCHCTLPLFTDRRYETVILPIYGSPTPFHIATIKVSTRLLFCFVFLWCWDVFGFFWVQLGPL